MTYNIQKVQTETSVILINENGIVHIHFKDFAYYDLPQEQEHLRICKQLTNNTPMPFVITTGEHVIFTKGVRDNYAQIRSQMSASAIALVVNNLAYRLIAQFYIKMQKPAIPFKIFTSRDQAFEWCKQYVNETAWPQEHCTGEF